jgi:hypothetical protein
MRWAGHTVLVGKQKGKRPLGRPMRRYEFGIRMNLKDLGWGMYSGFSWLRSVTGGRIL